MISLSCAKYADLITSQFCYKKHGNMYNVIIADIHCVEREKKREGWCLSTLVIIMDIRGIHGIHGIRGETYRVKKWKWDEMNERIDDKQHTTQANWSQPGSSWWPFLYLPTTENSRKHYGQAAKIPRWGEYYECNKSFPICSHDLRTALFHVAEVLSSLTPCSFSFRPVCYHFHWTPGIKITRTIINILSNNNLQ